jgi:hypothetical protein
MPPPHYLRTAPALLAGQRSGTPERTADMTQPRNSDREPAQRAGRTPEYVVVTWVSQQLRDRAQRNGQALADALQAGQEHTASADLEPPEREAGS